MRRSLASSSSKAARTVKETDAIKTPPVTRKQVGTEGKQLCAAIFSVIFFYSFSISTLKFTLSVFVPAECNLVKVCGSRALISKDDICLTQRESEREINQMLEGRMSS